MRWFAFAGIRPLRIHSIDGQALVEYSMILLSIAIACILAVGMVGNSVYQLYDAILAAWP